MKDGIERRRYLRAPLSLDMYIETPEGRINGVTADISIGGLSIILFLKAPEIDNAFKLTIKLPNGREMYLACETVWSGRRMIDDILYDAFGVRLVNIAPADKQIIKSLIEDHYLILKFKEKKAHSDQNLDKDS